MLVERTILITVWVITIIGLICSVPRNKLREAQLIFLFKQFVTWITGILVVEYHLIRYPVREFKLAYKGSFSFEFFIYPAVCVIFNLHFPQKRGWLAKIGWYILFPTWMTILEVLIEKYTGLIDYIHWAWYWTWLTLLVTFVLTRIYYLWFFKTSSHK
jgi:hypothetical protein